MESDESNELRGYPPAWLGDSTFTRATLGSNPSSPTKFDPTGIPPVVVLSFPMNHIPATHRLKDCICGGMKDGTKGRILLPCPACDGVFWMEYKDETNP